MTPTIVQRDGSPVFVLGSPGGPRITTAVLETLTNIVDFGLAPEQAVAMPRFHHQWLPDTLYYERGGLPAPVLAALAERDVHTQVRKLAVSEMPRSGKPAELLAAYGIDAAAIAEAARALVQTGAPTA
jgi:gamma-glutamyltranspeptidase